jgi:hypothetical protein
MRELKKASSIWVHEEIGLKTFAWQEGYAAFSVSPTSRTSVKRYIARQAEHHRKVPYRNEFRTLLRRTGIEYDERYLD